jgi:hypothetical protein
MARAVPAAAAVLDAMGKLAHRPDELTVTFGIELSGKAGGFIASTAATANFAVTATWRSAQPPDSVDGHAS